MASHSAVVNITHPVKISGGLPTVYVARRVIENMARGALTYLGEETGEAMVGVAIPQNGDKTPALYVLNTIPPVQDAVRDWAMFEQGDDWQGAIFNWWHENWELYRQLRTGSYGKALAGKWDAPLIHIGDWHKQPGGMIAPSAGDLRTARRFLRDLERDYMLAPIVTVWDEVEKPLAANSLWVETGAVDLRIDFWWLRRRESSFQPIEPVVEDDAHFPRFPPIVWWLAQRERFDMEMAALENDGLQVLDVVSWNTRGHPPLETCLTIYRPGNYSVYIAVTSVDYPARAPRWRIAPILRPKEGKDFFGELYAASREVSESDLPGWHAEMVLLDGVKALEKRHQ